MLTKVSGCCRSRAGEAACPVATAQPFGHNPPGRLLPPSSRPQVAYAALEPGNAGHPSAAGPPAPPAPHSRLAVRPPAGAVQGNHHQLHTCWAQGCQLCPLRQNILHALQAWLWTEHAWQGERGRGGLLRSCATGTSFTCNSWVSLPSPSRHLSLPKPSFTAVFQRVVGVGLPLTLHECRLFSLQPRHALLPPLARVCAGRPDTRWRHLCWELARAATALPLRLACSPSCLSERCACRPGLSADGTCNRCTNTSKLLLPVNAIWLDAGYPETQVGSFSPVRPPGAAPCSCVRAEPACEPKGRCQGLSPTGPCLPPAPAVQHIGRAEQRV